MATNVLEDLAQGIGRRRRAATPQRRAGVKDVAVTREGVRRAARNVVGFAHEHRVAVLGTEGGGAEATQARADDDDVVLLGGPCG